MAVVAGAAVRIMETRPKAAIQCTAVAVAQAVLLREIMEGAALMAETVVELMLIHRRKFRVEAVVQVRGRVRLESASSES